MYSTAARLTLTDINLSDYSYLTQDLIPKLVVEKRTGKIFALKVVFQYGGPVSDIQLSEITGGGVTHIRIIDLKQFYFVTSMKKTGGFNTAMEPSFKSIVFDRYKIDWYDVNSEIPQAGSWMISVGDLIAGNLYFMHVNANSNGYGFVVKNIPKFNGADHPNHADDIESVANKRLHVLRSVSVDGIEIYNGRVIL